MFMSISAKGGFIILRKKTPVTNQPIKAADFFNINLEL